MQISLHGHGVASLTVRFCSRKFYRIENRAGRVLFKFGFPDRFLKKRSTLQGPSDDSRLQQRQNGPNLALNRHLVVKF